MFVVLVLFKLCTLVYQISSFYVAVNILQNGSEPNINALDTIRKETKHLSGVRSGMFAFCVCVCV